MKTKLILTSALAVLALGGGTAFAGGSKGSLGVGGEEIFSLDIGGTTFRVGALSADYDVGEFHVGGFLGFFDNGGNDDTDVFLGGRFYYHIHSTAMADFGIGGTGMLGFIGDGDPNTDNTQVMILEPGLQIRAFIASNVALSLSAGLSIGLMDADGVAITGDPTGSAGFHYYFF
jgi:hypothetical protein